MEEKWQVADEQLPQSVSRRFPGCWRTCWSNEITHILQRVSRHSASGVMKARFNETDHFKMKGKGLGFTKEDIDLIHIGLA